MSSSKLSTVGILLLACLAGSIAAQAASSTATASGAAVTRVITVGQADHKFVPAVTQADVGDIIEFQFFPPNHSVVRAEYLYPCVPYEMTGRGKVGFFSGFKPVDAILPDPPKWRVTINDTNPIFFYCSAIGSCINYAMVGVINPAANTSLELHKQAARDSSYMLQPNEPFPSEGVPSNTPKATSSSATATTMVTVTSATSAAASTSAAVASDSHGGLSIGAIAGIAVGAVSILLLAAALCFFVGRSKTLKQEMKRQNTNGSQNPTGMYEHNSFLPIKSSRMTDVSSRHSGATSPRYENFTPMGMPLSDSKGYMIDVQETEYLRNTAGRSPSDGYGHSQHAAPVIHSPGIPIRHPSVLLNPNQPHEMESSEPRSNWSHSYGSDR